MCIATTEFSGSSLDDPTEAELNEHWRTTRPNVVDGFVKLKLVHAAGTSLLLPDLLAADIGGMRWFQPKFFTAPLLSFLDGFAVADFGIDITNGPPLSVRVCSGGYVGTLSDCSQVFRCLISGPPNFAQYSDGTCSAEAGGDFLLELFHHTTDASAEAIRASAHFRGSAWNVQGTRKLKNVAYAYFTSVRRVSSEEDLKRIAMASSGYIALRKTNATSSSDVIRLEVYRESTLNRTATLSVSVPSSLVASQHVYRHAPRGQAVYYEACNPYIYRVGLQPNTVAPFENGLLAVPELDRQRFDYMVLGDADTDEGLIAPYDEEETKSLLHIEACAGQTFFDFWRAHANTDQVAGREPQLLTFAHQG
jgi:hypothetical protein